MPAGEERVAIESEHLAAIVRSSDDAILSKDRNAIITSWNEAAERLYGYSADEVVGQSVGILIPPERQGEEFEIIEKILAGERVEHYDTERVRKDGTRVAVSLTASPIHGPDGEVVGVSTQARNISDTQRALEDSEQRFQGVPVGIAIIDLEGGEYGELKQVNAEMTRLLGYTPDELAALSPGELTHPDDAEGERVLFEDLVAGRRSSFGIEKRNRHKDGHWVWIWLTVSLLDQEDPPRAALAHVLDISQRKVAETELELAQQNLERSNAELDQFAYVASHDLKEPLILLSAYARMLERAPWRRARRGGSDVPGPRPRRGRADEVDDRRPARLLAPRDAGRGCVPMSSSPWWSTRPSGRSRRGSRRPAPASKSKGRCRPCTAARPSSNGCSAT